LESVTKWLLQLYPVGVITLLILGGWHIGKQRLPQKLKQQGQLKAGLVVYAE